MALITREAEVELRKKFKAAQAKREIPKNLEFQMRSVPTGRENEHTFFCVDEKGGQIRILGSVTGVVTVCG